MDDYMEDFDPNENQQYLPQGPDSGPIQLPIEIVGWAIQNGLLPPNSSGQVYGSYARQIVDNYNAFAANNNAARGASQPTQQQLRREGLVGDAVSGGQAMGRSDGSYQILGRTGSSTKLFPKCNIPKQWRMQHQKARGGHVAYLSRTEAAYFTRKASANAFVRAWNEMMEHLGSAADFDQLRLSSLFAAVVQAASGEQGVANGFSPPMNGQ